MRAAMRVAAVRSPVRFQAIARTTRPPSIGKAGSRLKTRTKKLIEASQANIATTPEIRSAVLKRSAWPRASLNSDQPAAITPARTISRAIARVTTGPPIATLNSVPGLSDSRSMRATPPKIQSWMLEMPIPLRIATTAWPSSWRTIAAKKARVLATASAKGSPELLGSPSTSP